MKKITIVFTLLILLKITSTSAQYTKIHDFSGGSNGFYPFSNLFFDGTYLYGTTAYGGLYNNGVIFKVKPNGTGYTTIFDFVNYLDNGSYGTLISDGTFLYGTTYGNQITNNHGTVYKIKPDGSDFTTLFTFNGLNGSRPYGGLYLNGQFLYGTTNYGGTASVGAIYKITTNGTNFETIFNFDGSAATSGYPYGELIFDGMFLYGTTAGGNGYPPGTVFKILPDGTGYNNLVYFTGALPGGSFPDGSLVNDGTFLYGTTASGGVNNKGSVFKVKPDGTEYQQLFSFDGNNGWEPKHNLVILGDYIYGMTKFGGVNSQGTIFRIKPDGTDFSKLFNFDGTTHGSIPTGSLISDGTFLYGMTSNGGENGYGVVFKFSPQNLENPEFYFPSDITIYPNPSDGLIKIETQSLTQFKIEVCNILGELITEQTSLNQQAVVDLTNHSAGVYIVKVYYDANKIAYRKIVIK